MTAGRNAARAAEDVGAEGYVAKPFELDDLLNKVGELCH